MAPVGKLDAGLAGALVPNEGGDLAERLKVPAQAVLVLQRFRQARRRDYAGPHVVRSKAVSAATWTNTQTRNNDRFVAAAPRITK